jgi:hypothetical protein
VDAVGSQHEIGTFDVENFTERIFDARKFTERTKDAEIEAKIFSERT